MGLGEEKSQVGDVQVAIEWMGSAFWEEPGEGNFRLSGAIHVYVCV